MVEKQLGKVIKTLQSDRGGKYLLGEFKDHLKEECIVSQLIAHGTVEYNGESKRRNRTSMDIVRSIMSYSLLSNLF